jgi:hypothetical protein
LRSTLSVNALNNRIATFKKTLSTVLENKRVNYLTTHRKIGLDCFRAKIAYYTHWDGSELLKLHVFKNACHFSQQTSTYGLTYCESCPLQIEPYAGVQDQQMFRPSNEMKVKEMERNEMGMKRETT